MEDSSPVEKNPNDKDDESFYKEGDVLLAVSREPRQHASREELDAPAPCASPGTKRAFTILAHPGMPAETMITGRAPVEKASVLSGLSFKMPDLATVPVSGLAIQGTTASPATFEPTKPPEGKPEIVPTATTVSHGIFDDADDEEDASMPLSTLKPNKSNSFLELQTQNFPMKNTAPMDVDEKVREAPRSDLMSIVLGKSPARKRVADSSPGPISLPIPELPPKSFEADVVEQPTKRRRKSATQKKLLVAKKERDAAQKLLCDKFDLRDFLPEEVCKFLGCNFWIFTVDQLRCVLKSSHDDEYLARQAKEIRKEIVELLKKKDGISSTGKGQNATGPMDHGENSTKTASTLPTTQITNRQQNHDGGNGTMEKDKAEQNKFENAGSVQAPDETVSLAGPNVEAESTLRGWLTMLPAGNESSATQVAKRFPLDGAISCLIPLNIRNFFASAGIKTLFEFLSIKKTETGSICDIEQMWRDQCNLKKMPAVALAKHLLGIGSRLEAAISTVPAVGKTDQKWMNDPIIVLTGAAHEFLVDRMGIKSGTNFLNMRTKDLSVQLVFWRNSKGLPPLKGSGKVAMISGWKASVKESIEVEQLPGKVLPFIDLTDLPPADLPEASSELRSEEPRGYSGAKHNVSKSSVVVMKEKLPVLNKQGKYALHSPLLLEEVLGKTLTSFLKSAGIDTAAKLFGAKRTPESLLGRAIRKSQIAVDADKAVTEWLDKIRAELKQFEPLPSPRQVRAKRAVEKTAKSVTDPFDALSALTKRFLTSMDISNAEQFLSARTTHIANEFVQFRTKEGMPDLKGLGAIASVSGWKAQCRKVAREMGLDAIGNIEPDAKSQVTPTLAAPNVASSKPNDYIDASMKRLPETKNLPFHPDVIFGAPRQPFSVQATQAMGNVRFLFHLSVRTEASSSQLGLFLCYDGASSGEVDVTENCAAIVDNIAGSQSSAIVLPVLRDGSSKVASTTEIVDHRFTFRTAKEGCGLIRLRKHGVRPFQDQDLSLLKEEIRSFLFSGNTDRPCEAPKYDPYNILLERDSLGKYDYLFCTDIFFEKGQMSRVQFISVSDFIRSRRHEESSQPSRPLIDAALYLISNKDLENAIIFVEEVLAETTDFNEAVDMMLASESDTERLTHFVAAARLRQRADWVFRRIVDAMSSNYRERKMATTRYKLYFGRRALLNHSKIKNLKPEILEQLRTTIATEMRNDFFSGIGLEGVYRQLRLSYWCPLAQSALDCLLDTIIGHFAMTDGANILFNVEEKLQLSFAKLLQEDPCVIHCLINQHGSSKQELDGRIVCVDQESEEARNTTLRTQVDVENGTSKICTHWYLNLLWQVAIVVISTFGNLYEDIEFRKDRIMKALKGVLEQRTDINESFGPTLDMLKFDVLVPLPLSDWKCFTPIPLSRQFFLGLVWPLLRKLGWRLDVGQTPDHVSFLAPFRNGHNAKKLKHAKHRMIQKRARLVKETNHNVGLGILSKSTKRICISTSIREEFAEIGSLRKVSTSKALDLFVEHVQDRSNEGNIFYNKQIEDVVNSIRVSFDELAPSLDSVRKTLDGLKPSESLGSEYLFQFLFILPSILRQSKIPMHQLDDAIEIVKELIAFLTNIYDVVLDEEFQPPKEVYAQDEDSSVSTLAARLSSKTEEGAERKGPIKSLTETVLEEDKPDLTDFMVVVLQQTIPIRATEEDMARKNRRVQVGFPGLGCRHCTGSGAGRYFFSSIDSVATAGTVIEKHVMKCGAIDAGIKAIVAEAKTRHTAQRKNHPQGLQQKFFNRLWDRLRNSKIGGESSGVYFFEKKDSADDAEHGEILSFSDHVAVLDYLHQSPRWREHGGDLLSAIHQYYNSLQYGSRVYGTSAMPPNFSSEWLLSKILPRKRVFNKAAMPG
jgi:hypothetical protein